MMGKPALTKTLPLAIILMILLPSDAVRRSRAMLMTRTEEHWSGAGALTDQVVGEEMLKEDFIHGRVDIEEITKNDYPGSGANNRHDPPNKP